MKLIQWFWFFSWMIGCFAVFTTRRVQLRNNHQATVLLTEKQNILRLKTGSRILWHVEVVFHHILRRKLRLELGITCILTHQIRFLSCTPIRAVRNMWCHRSLQVRCRVSLSGMNGRRTLNFLIIMLMPLWTLVLGPNSKAIIHCRICSCTCPKRFEHWKTKYTFDWSGVWQNHNIILIMLILLSIQNAGCHHDSVNLMVNPNIHRITPMHCTVARDECLWVCLCECVHTILLWIKFS